MRRRLLPVGLIAGGVAVASAIAIVPYAQAAGWRSTLWGVSEQAAQKPDVVSDCDGTGKAKAGCDFTPVRSWTTDDPIQRTSAVHDNCRTTGEVTVGLASAITIGSSITQGSSQATMVGATPFGAFIALKSQGFNRSTTVSDSVTMTKTLTAVVPAGYAAWTYFVPKMTHTGGWIKANYGHRVYDHYEWYYPAQNSDQVVYTTASVLPNGEPDGRAGVTLKKCGANN